MRVHTVIPRLQRLQYIPTAVPIVSIAGSLGTGLRQGSLRGRRGDGRLGSRVLKSKRVDEVPGVGIGTHRPRAIVEMVGVSGRQNGQVCPNVRRLGLDEQMIIL